MPHVVALYRHPIKGFTPESVGSLTVQADGRVAGDRVLAFRFADAATPEERDGLEHWPKAKGLALQDFPALAALRTHYDDARARVRIEHDGAEIADAGLDGDGRAELTDAVTAFVRATREGRRLERPGRLPSCWSVTARPRASRTEPEATFLCTAAAARRHWAKRSERGSTIDASARTSSSTGSMRGPSWTGTARCASAT